MIGRTNKALDDQIVDVVENFEIHSHNFNQRQEDRKVGSTEVASQVPECRVFEEALPGSLFERLVRAVRSVGNERLKKNYTTTFWYPNDAEPTNVVEETVIELSKLVNPPDNCSGVEWWLGRLGHGEKLRYHFDRDMTVRKKTGEFLHPAYSSVLYLNTFPASPTVILNQVPTPDGKSRIPPKPTARKSVDAVSNRYIVFPGNIRHGVIPDRVEQINPTSEKRLTLLVNFWINRPLPPICFDYDGKIYGGLQEGDVFQARGQTMRLETV